MTDNNKKFKFNIIDVILILMIICVGIFAVRFFNDQATGGATSAKTYYLTFYGEEVADFVIEKTAIGDATWDFDSEVALGPVVDIVVDESRSYVETEDGEFVMGPKEGYSSVYITVEVQGTESPNGIIVDGVLYSAGHSVVLYAGFGKFFLKTFDMVEI